MKLKIIILLLMAFPNKMLSQVSIANTTEIAKIKSGTTFFAMKDPASPKAVAYVEAIKKYWTLSKVECIKYSDVEKNIAPNNSFVTLSAKMTSSEASTETNFSLEFWTTDGKFVYDPKKRKHFNQDEKILIASIELFPDFFLQNNPSSAYKLDYDSAGHLKNWSAGILGNYIQQLIILLNNAGERQAKTEFMNKSELVKLGTLYIPEYALVKFPKNSGDESKKMDIKEISEGTGLNCSVIPMDELNTKILISETPFYYLLLIRTSSAKWVTVTNSKTGEIIYSGHSLSPGNLKSGDLKAILKK